MKNKGSGRIILFYLAFFLVVILVAGLLRSSGGNQKEIDYGTVVQKFQKGEIHRYYVDTDYNLYLSDTVGTDEQNAKKTRTRHTSIYTASPTSRYSPTT